MNLTNVISIDIEECNNSFGRGDQQEMKVHLCSNRFRWRLSLRFHKGAIPCFPIFSIALAEFFSLRDRAMSESPKIALCNLEICLETNRLYRLGYVTEQKKVQQISF